MSRSWPCGLCSYKKLLINPVIADPSCTNTHVHTHSSSLAELGSCIVPAGFPARPGCRRTGASACIFGALHWFAAGGRLRFTAAPPRRPCLLLAASLLGLPLATQGSLSLACGATRADSDGNDMSEDACLGARRPASRAAFRFPAVAFVPAGLESTCPADAVKGAEHQVDWTSNVPAGRELHRCICICLTFRAVLEAWRQPLGRASTPHVE
eukprot:365990-Chlamydomonas_euryale.AAC.26